MSMILSGASAASKTLSSCVRPGVFEVRASPLVPVRALISEDLPTLERPAKAISSRSIGGRSSILTQPLMKTKGRANSSRPASTRSSLMASATLTAGLVGLGRPPEAGHDIAEQVHLRAVAPHDDVLLGDRQRVVARPVQH